MKTKLTSFFVACFAVIFFIIWPIKTTESEGLDIKIREADEILVKFKNDSRINLIKIAQPADVEKILRDYNKMASVEYAEPNYLYQASIIPSDAYYNNQWYLQKIKAAEAWNEVRETPRIVIAILDSGIQIDHPDLKDNIWRNEKEIEGNKIDDDKNGFIDDVNGWDFVNNVADPVPKFKEDFTEAGILHGTIVAGIAAASGNNAAGITGVTWRMRIMPLKVLDDKGEGNTNSVIKAIDYAIANGADIINLSFVGFSYSQALEAAIKRAYDAGIIIVAAAGNEQEEGDGYFLDDTPMYPACHDGSARENMVIGVAATDTLDQKASFSSYGFKCVDIAAPGISIFSTVVYSPTNYIDGKSFNNYYDGYWSGTSMAAPMVSAAFALIQEANPNFKRSEAINALLDSADNINRLNPNYLNQLGKGRLNLYAAVTGAKAALAGKTTELIIAPYSNYASLIKITDDNGEKESEFNAYGDVFRGGVNIASGDIDGDGASEIIAGPVYGGGPQVRIFDSGGKVRGQFFAYPSASRSGISVAACDINNDGTDEIITGPGLGASPQVKIFDSRGNVKGQFLAYAQTFGGGVNVACGDVDGDGQNEIVTGPGKGGGPQIRIFRSTGYVEGQFFAYDKAFRGGARVALADIDGGARGNRKEIIAAAGPGGGPHVKIFNNRGELKGQFFAYGKNFNGGVNLAAGDIDKDGLAEIITGAGPGGTPHVRIFETNGRIIGAFYGFEEEFNGGVNVAAIEQ
ncbi:S8 family serine peptidase [Candidatus Falkowbacteria bacterium]|nr:S8 family serine peptidase [Candidatus Falkowbacteria bacterium]